MGNVSRCVTTDALPFQQSEVKSPGKASLPNSTHQEMCWRISLVGSLQRTQPPNSPTFLKQHSEMNYILVYHPFLTLPLLNDRYVQKHFKSHRQWGDTVNPASETCPVNQMHARNRNTSSLLSPRCIWWQTPKLLVWEHVRKSKINNWSRFVAHRKLAVCLHDTSPPWFLWSRNLSETLRVAKFQSWEQTQPASRTFLLS